MSAVSASPAAQGSPGAGDPVRALQHALYRAAKADPGRRFHALYDKVSRSDVLWRAWVAVRRNNGAPGIDKITLAAVEGYGVTRLLGELASELKEHRYRPMPARRVDIPKPGTSEQRPPGCRTCAPGRRTCAARSALSTPKPPTGTPTSSSPTTSKASCPRLRGSASTARTEERQKVLRLLVKDVLIGPEKITIRHRIPLRDTHPATGRPAPESDTEGDHRPGYPLRWGRVQPRHV